MMMMMMIIYVSLLSLDWKKGEEQERLREYKRELPKTNPGITTARL